MHLIFNPNVIEKSDNQNRKPGGIVEEEVVVNLASEYWRSDLNLKWFFQILEPETTEIHTIEPE